MVQTGGQTRPVGEGTIMAQLTPNIKNTEKLIRISNYLYQKGNIYYFRYVLPKERQLVLGGKEIRLSLRTPYLRQARLYIAKLYSTLLFLLQEEPMLKLQEIKRRLAHLLLEDIERQAKALELLKNNKAINEVLLASGADKNDAFVDSKTMYIVAKECNTNPRCQEELFRQSIATICFGPGSENLTEEEVKEICRTPFTRENFFHAFAHARKDTLTSKGIFTEEEFAANKGVIGKYLLQSMALHHEYVMLDESGDLLRAEKLLNDHLKAIEYQKKPEHLVEPDTTVGLSTKTYSQAVSMYVKFKRSTGHWMEHTVADHVNRLNYLIYLLGDIELSAITREHMHTLFNKVQKLPPNRAKLAQYAGKSVDEVIAMNLGKKTLSLKTVNMIMAAVSSFFEWCISERLMHQNPAQKLQVKDTRQAINLREAFTHADLESIFTHPKFVKGQFKYPAYFWIPLIGLFTGMRLEEIAQLHCADIKEFKPGFWLIDISEDGKDETGFERTLKNKNARRQVPIHKTLVDLGLIDYVTDASQKKHLRLFPELNKTENTVKLGKQPGKQFKTVIKSALPNSEKKSFHSLRHTFADFYKQRGLQTDMFRQLYGHEIPHLAASQYGSKFPAELLYIEVIEKLDYGVDLSALMDSKFRTSVSVTVGKKNTPKTTGGE